MEETQKDLLGDPEEAAKRLGEDAPNPELLSELQAASERFRNEVRRHISLVEDDKIVLDGGGARTLRLPSAPVHTATARIDDEPVDIRVSPNGLLQRRDGRMWPDHYGNVQVTYTHGFDPVPSEIVELVTDAAVGRLATERGLSSLQVGGVTQTFSKTEQSGTTEAWVRGITRWRIRSGDRA